MCKLTFMRDQLSVDWVSYHFPLILFVCVDIVCIGPSYSYSYTTFIFHLYGNKLCKYSSCTFEQYRNLSQPIILDDTHFYSIKKVTRITKNRYWNYFQFVHQLFHFLMFAWQVALSNDLHLLLFHRGRSVYVVTIKLYSTIVFLSHTLKRKTPHLLGWK